MEKFQTFSRGKVILFCASFLGLMVLVFMACKNDFTMSDAEPDKPLTAKIEAAKKWFETQQQTEGKELQIMKPQWNKAFSVHNVVEVPFTINGKFRIPTTYKGLKYLGRQRLVIYNNGLKGRQGYIVNYMPSEKFQGKIADINAINFRYKKFSGRLAVYTLKKESIGQFVYADGKFVERRRELARSSLVMRSDDGCESSTEYECTVLNGENFCSEVAVITCTGDEDPCEDASPPSWCSSDPCESANPPSWCGGLDPCDGINPPSYCDGSDPCDGPNPPAYCNNTGGCTDPDPCVCDPNGAGCNECVCQTQSAEIPLKSIIWDISNKDYISLVLTSMDCKTGQSDIDLSHFIQEIYPGSITFANEYARRYFVAPIDPDKPNCGKNVTFICHSVVTYSRWLPSNQNLPAVITMHDYKSINFD